MIVYLLGQLDLDGVEELPINNGRLLARANFRFPEPHSASPALASSRSPALPKRLSAAMMLGRIAGFCALAAKYFLGGIGRSAGSISGTRKDNVGD
jgi:hypothetical protein